MVAFDFETWWRLRSAEEELHRQRREAQRRAQVQPRAPRILTLDLLGDAYKGGRKNLKVLLSHTLVEQSDGSWPETSLCGRIPSDHLVDAYGMPPERLNGPPTCPTCLKRDPRFARTAQFQNTKDHNFYDGDDTYSATQNMFDAPAGDGGPNQGLGPQEVRENFEDSNVTNTIPSEAVSDFAPSEDIRSTNEFETTGEVGPTEHGVWDGMEGSPAHRASIRVRADVAIRVRAATTKRYWRVQPKGAKLLGWTSSQSDYEEECPDCDEPAWADDEEHCQTCSGRGYVDKSSLLEGFVFAYDNAKFLDTEWGQEWLRGKKPQEVVEFEGSGEYNPGDFEGVAVKPTREISRSPLHTFRRRQLKRKADVAIHHPERYEDTPGLENGQMTHFFPNEMMDSSTPHEEGEQRFEDLDGVQPLGRPSSMSPGTSSDMLDGDLGGGDHDLEGQTPHGFQEHEAEQGASLQDLTNPGREDSVLSTSPDDPMDWMGRAADVRTSVRIRGSQRRQEVGNVGEDTHEQH